MGINEDESQVVLQFIECCCYESRYKTFTDATKFGIYFESSNYFCI